MKIYLLCLVIVLTEARPPSETRIVGGELIDVKEVPFQLSLENFLGFPGYKFMCGAVIVGANAVLTAGHCVDPQRPYDFRVKAGSNSRLGGIVHDIDTIVMHPKYHYNYTYQIDDYDIAFLTTKEPFNFTDSVQPIDFIRIEPDENASGRITGWGVDESGDVASQLRQVNVSIVSRETCNRGYYDSGIIINSRMICGKSLEDGRGPCKGDSGGPLVVDGVLAGLASWGDPTCDVSQRNAPMVYTNVAYFSGWVAQQIDNAKNKL